MGGKGGHVPPCPPEVGSSGGTWTTEAREYERSEFLLRPVLALGPMTRDQNPPAPEPDPDPSTAARREALSESLRPGGHRNQARAYSTLVRRPERHEEGPECPWCQRAIWSLVGHLSEHVYRESYPPGFNALLAAVRAYPISLSATAGAAQSNNDEVQCDRDHEASRAEQDEQNGGDEDQ